jgi:hypothetical protein
MAHGKLPVDKLAEAMARIETMAVESSAAGTGRAANR